MSFVCRVLAWVFKGVQRFAVLCVIYLCWASMGHTGPQAHKLHGPNGPMRPQAVHGPMGARAQGPMGQWHGPMGPWVAPRAHELGPRAHELGLRASWLGRQTHVPTGLRVHGPMNNWDDGPVDAWAHWPKGQRAPEPWPCVPMRNPAFPRANRPHEATNPPRTITCLLLNATCTKHWLDTARLKLL